MTKKLFTLLLAVAASVGTMFASDTEVNGIYYDFEISTQTATVTYRGSTYYTVDNEYKGSVVIPQSVVYDGVTYRVTCIGDRTFYNCNITSVTIPNSVTYIGEAAFVGCTGLTSVTIPNSVTMISTAAFNACSGLTSVTIGNSVVTIGQFAFEGCIGLTFVTIPNSVDYIGYSAFNGCTGLTSVTIGNSVQYIGESAFSGCTGLASIEIPNSVTSIGESAFSGCTGLASIEIPNSVTSIGESAFSGCTGLSSVSIPNSVTSIEDGVFKGCSSLTSVSIPNSITNIESYAFSGCTELLSITCEAMNPPTCSSSFAFLGVSCSIPLYVSANSVSAYKEANVWKQWGDNIKPIQSAEVEVIDLTAEPTENSVTIEWPKVDGAVVYTIEIKKNGELICTLSFNESGQLLSIAYAAPARNGSSRKQPAAIQTSTGWQYTISGLDPNTEYSYTVIAKRSDDSVVYNKTVLFKTQSTATSLDQTSQESIAKSQKLIKDGQIFILRGDHTYDAQGKLIK